MGVVTHRYGVKGGIDIAEIMVKKMAGSRCVSLSDFICGASNHSLLC